AIGAYAHLEGNQLVLRAVVLAEDGTRVLRAQAAGAEDAQVVESVRRQLDGQGAGTLLRTPTAASPVGGLRVMVPRADQQSSALAQALEERGAAVVVCPTVLIEPIEVEAEQLRLDGYDWLVLTSANGVDRLFQLGSLSERGLPPHIKVAAIGPQTAARLLEHGVRSAIVPERYVAEELAEAIARVIEPGARILLARAEGAREVLPQRLRADGAQVDVVDIYRARPPAALRRLARETQIAPQDLIYPLFVREGIDAPQPIEAMPGQQQHTLDSLAHEVEAALKVGVGSFVLFGIPARKDAQGSEAWAEGGIVQRALRQVREAFGTDVLLIA